LREELEGTLEKRRVQLEAAMTGVELMASPGRKRVGTTDGPGSLRALLSDLAKSGWYGLDEGLGELLAALRTTWGTT
jgi:hypothetical protein